MKDRGMVEAARFENWMLYSLVKETCAELEKNMKCLQDCSQEYPVFKEDLMRLQSILQEVNAVKKKM